ncbi:MAG: magnesium/cobalt transporter CorA [Bacteroidales bacterium]|nr:magnesium/cobalt transporter CorA [Bacteroidales bacterium]
MSRTIPRRKEDIGRSPYEMVFRGLKKTDHASMFVMDYNSNALNEAEIKEVEELTPLIKSKSTTWLNVNGLDNLELMEKLVAAFGIDQNIMADIMNPLIRPKVQEFENGLFVTLKMLQINKENKLSAENLSLLVLDKFIISFQESGGDVFDPVRERIRRHKSKIRTKGADYLSFALLDVVIDNYIYILSLLGERIENLENRMTDTFDKQMPTIITSYKQELNYLRRIIKPTREMILTLAKMETEFIQKSNRVNYKELQDNINEANELADSYREMLYDLLNIYHSSATTRLNDIMKLLTIISVIFIPLTFIVGVYGTNFKYFPEINWRYGYFAMWGLMILVAAFMIWYFKKKDWF